MCILWPKQPLHVVLRQYRVLPVLITLFFIWQTWDLTEWYKANYQNLHEWQNAPIMAYLGVLVGVLKFAYTHFSEPVKQDHLPEKN